MLKHITHKPIEIKIATIVAIFTLLRDTNLTILDTALQEMTAGTADFFDNEFTIIDVAALNSDQALDWVQLIKLLKKYRLNAIAVRNAPAHMEAGIILSGLSIDYNETSRQEPVATARTPALIIDTQVRAGQRIYARDSDLIVTATVNNGAEIIADGNIHVYAPLRGRALAGANGNTSARIFTASMEAELVSIAGVYRIFENQSLPERQAAQILRNGDRIDVLSLDAIARI